jgi:hypothetical protein
MNLLQITNNILSELGLNETAVVVNTTDSQVRQVYRLINRSVRELQQNYDWTALQTEYDLHVAQPTTTTGNLVQGSYQITGIPTTAFIAPAASLWVVTAPFLPVNTRVMSVDSPTQVTVSQPATGTTPGLMGGDFNQDFNQDFSIGNNTNTIVFAKDTYPEPSDFSRFINQTWWDRTNRWALMGPDSPQVDQWHRSGVVTIGPRRHFRQIGSNGIFSDFNSDFNTDFSAGAALNNYRLWPPPGATDTPLDLVFEYISQNVVYGIPTQTAPYGNAQSTFQADTDITVLDPNMIILDTKWRFWQIKGFDYLPMQMEARDYIDRAYANDGGAKTLSISNKRANFWLSTGYTPDGSWPGPGLGGTSTSGI